MLLLADVTNMGLAEVAAATSNWVRKALEDSRLCCVRNYALAPSYPGARRAR
ncbi:hypothetical protein [Burkholderia glumae]|uniref:hypothetical protein n=1 Tax=Burkholderia glumae TaxID=337 RepID=UPI00148EAA72|nr:hypothetical protein [Burkholderia glumae]QJW82564.1 hypothetical protein GAS18_28540 [Burkholderia glumae]